jgi:hypothetical protein
MDINKQESQERLLFKNALWKKIREVVEQEKEKGFSTEDVDEMASLLTS